MYVPQATYQRVNKDDLPRKLTDSELNNIVSAVPQNPCPDPEFGEVYRRQLRAILKENLSKVELCPSAIPEMKNMIVRYHIDSLMDRGTAIGFQAAEAAGATLTQMILNAFHSSGGAESSQGLDGVKDAMFARQNVSKPLAFIYFKDKSINIEQVIGYRSQLVGITVADLVIEDELLDPEEFKPDWWYDHEVIPNFHRLLRVKFDIKKMYEYRITLKDIYVAIMRGPGNSELIKAVFSPMAYATIDIFCLESKDIQTFIAEANKINAMCSSSQRMKVLPQDFFNTTTSTEADIKYLAESHVLNSVIFESFKCTRLKGIPGIKNLRPVKQTGGPLSLIKKEEPIYNESPESQAGRLWSISVSEHKAEETGMSIKNVRTLLEAVGCKTERDPLDRWKLNVLTPFTCYKNYWGEIMARKGDDYFIHIPEMSKYSKWDAEDGGIFFCRPVHPDEIDDSGGIYLQTIGKDNMGNKKTVHRNDIRCDQDGNYILPVLLTSANGQNYEVAVKGTQGTPMKPTEIVNYYVKIDKEKFERESKTNKSARRSRLIELTSYIYAVAELNNSSKAAYKNILRNLLCMPFVDSKRTYTNDMHMIRDTLGIEASWYFNYINILGMIKSKGAYINAANIITIVDSITNRGQCYGATFNGISRQTGGHLSLSSVEKAGDVIVSAGIAKEKESVSNSTAAVFMGHRNRVGTGAFHVMTEIIENGQKKTLMNEEVYTALNRDDRYRDAIKAVKEEANRRSLLRRPNYVKEDEEYDEEKAALKEVDLDETLGVKFGQPVERVVRFEQMPNQPVKPVTSVFGGPDQELLQTMGRSKFTQRGEMSGRGLAFTSMTRVNETRGNDLLREDLETRANQVVVANETRNLARYSPVTRDPLARFSPTVRGETVIPPRFSPTRVDESGTPLPLSRFSPGKNMEGATLGDLAATAIPPRAPSPTVQQVTNLPPRFPSPVTSPVTSILPERTSILPERTSILPNRTTPTNQIVGPSRMTPTQAPALSPTIERVPLTRIPLTQAADQVSMANQVPMTTNTIPGTTGLQAPGLAPLQFGNRQINLNDNVDLDRMFQN